MEKAVTRMLVGAALAVALVGCGDDGCMYSEYGQLAACETVYDGVGYDPYTNEPTSTSVVAAEHIPATPGERFAVTQCDFYIFENGTQQPTTPGCFTSVQVADGDVLPVTCSEVITDADGVFEMGHDAVYWRKLP